MRVEDRAAGVVLGTAFGDALGAGYEFGPPLDDDEPVGMIGGGGFGWAAGEWTDDRSMAVLLLRVAARGDRLEGVVLDEVAAAWTEWARSAPDVGTQTRAVLDSAVAATANGLSAASLAYHRRHPDRSAGNGSLMRTAPVALAYLDDRAGLIAAAREVSDLTHADPLAGDGCVIWTLAIRSAVLIGELDVGRGVESLPADRQPFWNDAIAAAETGSPRDFPANGWVGGALQAAWSAVVRATSLQDALERAVRGGHDTDTVAAIAGGLVGAVHGAAAAPPTWRALVHGWPGLTADDLADLAMQAVGHRHP